MNTPEPGELDPEAPLFDGKEAAWLMKQTVSSAARNLRNLRQGIRRHPRRDDLLPELLGEARLPLWSQSSAAGPLLQMGRVQNLRCAVNSLNGVRVPAGAVFSFWRQAGRPGRSRGFVPGLTCHEDRLVAATGGGLWQLAGALYEAALQTELQVVERCPHLHRIPDTEPVRGCDAFVEWNSPDLRLRGRFEWQVELRLTATELLVRLRGHALGPGRRAPSAGAPVRPGRRNDIGRTPGSGRAFDEPPVGGRTFYVLDKYTPEFQSYLDARRDHAAGFAIPLDGETWNRPAYAWKTRRHDLITASRVAQRRARRLQRLAAGGRERLLAELERDQEIALALAKKLPADALHLVVMQPLLPWLWLSGFLGGRSFEVLMTQLPHAERHAILDEALRACPQRETLGSFRAPEHVVNAEADALAAAQRLVTPHAAIAGLFPASALKVPWQLTARAGARRPAEFTIAFPGPVTAEKGAFEVREAARALGIEVVLYGAETEGIGFWAGVRTRRAAATGNRLEEVSVVVQPALVDNEPRSLLTALASGVPVVATAACGLDPHPNLFIVPPGDTAALTAVLAELRRAMTRVPRPSAPVKADTGRQT